MYEAYKIIKVTEELTLKIYQDIDPINPCVDWDELGTIQAYHKRYELGHEHYFNDVDELKEYLETEKCVYLPLYLYDHSGITISVTPFSCNWDSGQIGWIYITDEKIRKEFGVKRISQQLRERIKGYLINQIKTYDQFLTGDVYGYQLIKNEVCNCCKHIEEIEITSCWGYFGDDFSSNGLIDDMDTTEFIRSLIKSKIND